MKILNILTLPSTFDLQKVFTMKFALLVIFISSASFAQPSYAAASNLERCLGAVFGSAERKRLKIYRHHFNCKPIKVKNNTYSGRLSHNVKWDFDEQMDYKFKLKPDGKLDIASFSVDIKFTKKGKWARKGISYIAGKTGYKDEISTLVNKAKKRIRGDWKSAGNATIAHIIERAALQQKRASRISCNAPTLWQHASFSGKKLITKKPNRNMHSKKFGDITSSACVPKGWAIRIYENRNLKGNSVFLEGPAKIVNLRDHNVKGKHFDNRVSSINVVRR